MRLLTALPWPRARTRREPTRRDWALVAAIHRDWETLESLPDESLRERWQSLRMQRASQRARRQAELEGLAIIAEAARRGTGKRYYDVQLLAGLLLARGCITEMQTGEGKTLTTLLPAAWLALAGRGVHVATTNAYLAARDHAELKLALDLLGLTSGVLPEQHDDALKRGAYRCDVTFGTGYEFGFDYLRDQLAARARRRDPLGAKLLARLHGQYAPTTGTLQRPPAFALIDEADSVLIDEATMPLILSGPGGAPPSRDVLQLAADTAQSLRSDADVLLDEQHQSIQFTEAGWRSIHATLQSAGQLPLLRPWSIYVESALRAWHFLQRDVDYVIRDDAVCIVDPQTGRIHEERSWRDGLHQAVEFREGVTLTPERASDARVTRQRCLQRYDQLAGMTGTAAGVEPELQEMYGLSTVVIPTHRPCRREVRPLRCFASSHARDAAVVAEVLAERRRGRPVLVGTRTILHSRTLSDLLQTAGVPHNVLNGVQDRAEAEIVAQAGRSAAVTIATNMAGRGTDIKLDDDARHAGGLHVIAAEHHASSRVDRQLAGRAGRQGDPGSCRVFAAADDHLFTALDTSLPERIQAGCDPNGESPHDFSAEIRTLQDRLERRQREQRRQMVQRDHWLDGVLETLAAE